MAGQVILSVKLFERCFCLFDAERAHETDIDEMKMSTECSGKPTSFSAVPEL